MISPLVGFTRPSNARPSVDLPEPDSPTSPSTSPGARSMLTPSMARTVPDELPTRRATALLRNAQCTSRAPMEPIGSGFIGHRDLLPPERPTGFVVLRV